MADFARLTDHPITGVRRSNALPALTDLSFVALDVGTGVRVRVAFTDFAIVLITGEAVVAMQLTEHRRAALVFDASTIFASEAWAAIDHRTQGVCSEALTAKTLLAVSARWVTAIIGVDDAIAFVADEPFGAIDVGGRKAAILAAAIINGLGSIGPIFQEEIIGYTIDNYGYQASFNLLIGVSFVAILGVAYLAHRSKRGLTKL